MKHSLPPGNSSTGQPVGPLAESWVTRVNYVGGSSKQELLAQLAAAGVELNEAASILFSSDRFTTSNTRQPLFTVELAVRHLGITQGAPLSPDEKFPKGFYLRCIKGTPWLRGYWTSAENLWDPDDHLVFCRPPPEGCGPTNRGTA